MTSYNIKIYKDSNLIYLPPLEVTQICDRPNENSVLMKRFTQ